MAIILEAEEEFPEVFCCGKGKLIDAEEDDLSALTPPPLPQWEGDGPTDTPPVAKPAEPMIEPGGGSRGSCCAELVVAAVRGGGGPAAGRAGTSLSMEATRNWSEGASDDRYSLCGREWDTTGQRLA